MNQKLSNFTIWNITVGEPIPQDGKHIRLHRAGQICEWLSSRGHNVTFLNSTFNHQKRLQRYTKTTTSIISENLRVVCLFARSYSSSVSLNRIFSHRDAASSLRDWLKTEPKDPDLIIVSYPIAELCDVASEYSKSKNIPIIMDCRDFWPDIFIELFPSALSWVGKIALWPVERSAKKIISRADGICSHTKSGMHWGLGKAGRLQGDKDFFFPFTYPESTAHIGSSSFDSEPGILTICFLGTLSHRSGLEKYIRSLGELSPSEKKKVSLIVGGIGPHMEKLQNLVVQTKAPVKFLGWLDQNEIKGLMEQSDFGLLPYDRKDFHMSLPNKFVEYLYGGLPVLSCTEGEVREFIKTHEVGVWSGPTEREIFPLLVKVIGRKFTFDRDYLKGVYTHQFSARKVYGELELKLKKIACS